MKINKNALIRSYAQSMGIEAAKELITKKIKSAALEEKEHYTEEEVAKICGELIKEGGLIRIVAQNFVVQLERKRSEEQALLLDNIETQIWYLTDRETYGAVNKAQAEFLGMEKEKLEGRVLYDIISVEEADVCIANNKEVFEKKKQSHTEEWVKNGRGETRLLSITRTPKIDDNGTVEYVICAAEDITERKHVEERIEHRNSVLKAIRKVNQLITMEKDRNRLLQGACDNLIETRGYYNAWITLIDESGSLVTAAEAGLGKDFLPLMERLKRGELTDCWQKALMQSQVVATEDPFFTCADCPLSDKYHDRGALTARLEYGEKVYGLLSVSISKELTADKEEQNLFKEVAGDLAFALYSIGREEERKWAEEEVKKSRKFIDTIIETIPDPLYIKDRQFRFVEVNKAFCRTHKVTKGEILGEPRHRETDDEVFETGKELEIPEQHYTDAEGDQQWTHLKKVPLTDESGNTTHVLTISRDITERKQAEEELRNAEQDWRNSFNSLEDVMLIIDRDYNIENINEIGLKLLGKSNEEVIGKKCYQIISGADSPSEDCPCRKSLETKKVESLDRYEERFEKYFSIKSSPIFDDNGEIIKFVDLRRDITERKRAEDKVKEAYRLREHFLKETSHRIITPVAIIGGHAELLLESSNLDEDQKEKIRIIRERNEEVQKLVRDALLGKYLEEGEGGEG